MLELRKPGPGDWLGTQWDLGCGGDVFNTATYLARLGGRVRFLSVLGSDSCSDELLVRWRDEGLDTSLVLRHPTRLPGLYAIRTDAAGERSFFYWREHSAMRALFELPGTAAALRSATDATVFFLSGITLSLFDEEGRAALRGVAERIRAKGGTIAFDPNYRPRGWKSADHAQAAMRDFAQVCSIVLPTLDDEILLWEERSPEGVAERWLSAGATEVVVKMGAFGCHVHLNGCQERVDAERVTQVVDTSGAGDAFNAAYLAHRLHGGSARSAAEAGHRLAARKIQHPGAIMPRIAMFDPK
jgi:2-dehydro-3-deoxygluconokinase